MTTENTTETPEESNVVSMFDFLVKRYIHQSSEANRLMDSAEALSKQDKDKFAAPLRTKAQKFNESAASTKKHLQFIVKKDNVSIPVTPEGYTLTPTTIPTVTISLNTPKDE